LQIKDAPVCAGEASPLRVATDGPASRKLEDSWPSLARPHKRDGAVEPRVKRKAKSMDKKVSAMYRVYCVSTVPVPSVRGLSLANVQALRFRLNAEFRPRKGLT